SRCAEIVEIQDHRRNRAEDRGAAAVLIERVDAEARELRDLEGEVRFKDLLEILPLFVVHDVVYHTVHFFVLQRRHVDPLDITIDANDWRDSGRQMQVRCIVLDGKSQELSDIYGGHNCPLRKALSSA